jgi:SAM-dependent methyltransferase
MSEAPPRAEVDWRAFSEVFDYYASGDHGALLHDFYVWMVDQLDAREMEPGRFLEMGCGTGLLAEKLVEWYPEARFELVDKFAPMLELARERFESVANVSIHEIDGESYLARCAPAHGHPRELAITPLHGPEHGNPGNNPYAHLRQCHDDLAECAENPPYADSDADGEHDQTDQCPGTAPGAAVDTAGCSLSQFCNPIDVSTGQGRQTCRMSDWPERRAGKQPAGLRGRSRR